MSILRYTSDGQTKTKTKTVAVLVLVLVLQTQSWSWSSKAIYSLGLVLGLALQVLVLLQDSCNIKKKNFIPIYAEFVEHVNCLLYLRYTQLY